MIGTMRKYFIEYVLLVLFVTAGAHAAGAVAWPAQRDGLLFCVRSGIDDVIAFSADGAPIESCKLAWSGKAWLDGAGGLRLKGGAFSAPAGDAFIAAQIQKSGAFSIEAEICADDVTDERSAVILALRNDAGAAIELIQTRDALSLSWTPAGEHSMPARIGLFTIKAGEPATVCLSYDGRQVIAAMNAAGPVTKESGDWKLATIARLKLTLGSGSGQHPWRGRMGAAAVFARTLAAEEQQKDLRAMAEFQRSRNAPATLKFSGMLIEKSPAKTPQQIPGYDRSLSLYKYRVEKVLAGKYEKKSIIVAHWTMLDRTLLAFKDAPLNERHTLEVEPMKDNKQLEHENQSDELDLDDSDMYFDATGAALDFSRK